MRYEEEFAAHLETLRHGGLEAVFLYVDVARDFYERGDQERASSWIGTAIVAIPETDRPAALRHLLRKLSPTNPKAHLHLVHPTIQ
jgi:hypothetical protein